MAFRLTWRSGSRDPMRDSRGLQALFTLLCSAYAPFLSQDPMWDSRDLQSPFTLLCEFLFLHDLESVEV